ncbi:S9 family peptidase [Terrimonas sp. NA20]|uniref:S9 family peptidase n=1 Tax=Terrimonas ginsenosidimutans TaxID=2908004 RepID=A0ABS9KLE6_9BACT|nr:S9 family peptidase [Terrimonas ginsenosidimutans]MCG2613153.1 S9 family peptidase [Terrimonas ginsenosidimutans]
MLKILLPAFCLVFAIDMHAQQGTEPVKLTDMLKIKSVTALSLTADGSKAVIGINSIEADNENKGEYKYVNQLWMMPSDGSAPPTQLTTRENASQPAWSPDGKELVFVRFTEGKPQLFLLSLNGGEPRQITRSKYGASSPKWSRDGKQLLFSASIPLRELIKDSILNPGRKAPEWAVEKPGIANNQVFSNPSVKADPDGNLEEVRAWLETNVTDRKAKVVTRLDFQDETDVNAEMSFNHFFTLGIAPDARPVALTKGFFSFGSAEFTADGKQVILTGDINSRQHPDRALETGIYLVNSDGSGMTTLLWEQGKAFANPRISNSGKWIAFQYGPSLKNKVGIPVLGIMSISGDKNSITDIPFDRIKTSLTWSADDKYVYFTSPSNGGTPVYRADVKTKKVEQLTDQNGGITSFDLVGNKLILSKVEVADPAEVYLADAAAKNMKRITDLNTGWLKSKKLSFPEKQTFVNEKGMTVEYWVMKPSNFEPGKKYPLLLEIHGGPAAMWGPGEASMWHEYQYYCSKGYGVVYCNPRGSGGYGVDFLRGNILDWGTGPTNDVLTALDKAVAQGWADTSKLLVTGGSYAGYLVAWIVGHDNRFKAACAQRGVYDLPTFFGEGNAWRLVPGYFGGYPWQDSTRTVLSRESPINYVQNIRTPFIIFHGENDRRTGFVQSEMLYRSLKVLDRPVEYVRHPGGTHELTRSGNNRQRMDQMLRTWEFFERWINTAK